jgi:threonine dehydrogenase-like Zn-dependent dehydrogenase
MKALVWSGVGDLRVEDIPEPEEKDQIIIRISYTGICGSNITIMSGRHPRAKAPLVLGHEFMGTIAYVPPNTGKYSSRDRG